MANLAGRTVLITGAAMGIGRALAVGMSRAGAKVVLVDVMKDALQELAHELGQSSAAVHASVTDISDVQAVESLQRAVRQKFGGIDMLVNNAAIGPEKNSPRYLVDKPKFWATNDELWHAMFRVNVIGVQLMSRVFVHDMLERAWGRIVNITTSLDTMYRPGIGPYGPCKAAVEALTRIMAQDLEGTGVTANVLVPGGPVNTRMVPIESGLSQSDLIQPEQMLAPLLWLASDESNDANGIRIVAQKWRRDASLETRLRDATAPVAWPQLGAQSIFPTSA